MTANDPRDPFDRPRDPGTSAFQDPAPGGQAFEQGDRSRSDVAKEQAADVKDHAADAGKDLTRTARDEAGSVARDARSEVRSLVDTSLHELRGQASRGQQQVAAQVRTLSSEFGEMASGNENSGTASKLAKQASEQGSQLASWLENHEPSDVVEQARRFAARRPLTFLAIAAGAGLLVGRFARGMQAEHADNNGRDNEGSSNQGYRNQGYGTQGYDTQSYYQGQRYGQLAPGTRLESRPPAGGGYASPPHQQPGHPGSGYQQEEGFVPGQGVPGGPPLGDHGGSVEPGGWPGETR